MRQAVQSELRERKTIESNTTQHVSPWNPCSEFCMGLYACNAMKNKKRKFYRKTQARPLELDDGQGKHSKQQQQKRYVRELDKNQTS